MLGTTDAANETTVKGVGNVDRDDHQNKTPGGSDEDWHCKMCVTQRAYERLSSKHKDI